jgi:hypothetical protein
MPVRKGENSMRIRLSLLCAVAATAALASTGAALGAGHSTPGTPGAANCHGQTMAYLNEAFKTTYQVNGIGNISDFTGLTVPQIQAIVAAYCA